MTSNKKLKVKTWSDKQLSRLPKTGYWLHIGREPLNRITLYCVKNGYIRYIRTDRTNPEWGTLYWTCMPTAKQINAGNEWSTWFHFETIDDMIANDSGLPKEFYVKPDNDF